MTSDAVRSPVAPGDVEPWDAALASPEARSGQTLEVDVEGYEGPLDMLLALARTQKVDLLGISIVSLADQFLAFVERARHARLELAADYLVMAAWLAYLKSRLLLPQEDEDDEPSAEDLASALRFRLRRLEAMRWAATSLVNRDRLDRDVFARGAPEALDVRVKARVTTNLYDLLKTYAAMRQASVPVTHHVEKRDVWSLEDARSALTRLLGETPDWTRFDAFLVRLSVPRAQRSSALATTFAAGLEMVREGAVDMQQAEPFAPLFIRARPA